MALTVPSTVWNSTHKSLISKIFSLWFMFWSHTFHLSVKLLSILLSQPSKCTVSFAGILLLLSHFEASTRYKYICSQFFICIMKKIPYFFSEFNTILSQISKNILVLPEEILPKISGVQSIVIEDRILTSLLKVLA